jgi:hypothetical protein
MDLTPAPVPNTFESGATSGVGGLFGGLGGESNVAFGASGADDTGGWLSVGVDGTSTNSASRDLAEALAKEEEPESHPLFYVGDSPGVTTCLGVITGGRGISRCCLMPVLSGLDRCGVGSHKT